MRKFLTRLVLKFSPVLNPVRRVSGFGKLLHSVSRSLLPPDSLCWVQVREGIGRGLWLNVNPRTGRDYYQGKVEASLQEILRLHLFPGMCFYDLGANLGFFTLVAARLIGEKGSVVALEADPGMAERLRENVEKNQFQNITIFNRAAWSSDGSVVFSRADQAESPDLGLGKVSPSAKPAERVIDVPSISLDCLTRLQRPPNFIKCDVEGAEFEVLAAARHTLTTYRPLVACEVHSDQNCERLEHFFKGLGYSLEWFSDTHFLATPARLT